LALAFDMFIAIGRIAGSRWAVGIGISFFLLAIASWYALEFSIRRKRPPMSNEKTKPTPLETQIDQLLTEARLIIPGAQALLGFQLTVTLTRAFENLPFEAKLAHAAALCCIAFAVILLMAPASLHRLAFRGQDDPEFLHIGSMFVITAPIPLALGIALDTYVATGRALESANLAAALALAALIVLVGFWYAYPLGRRTTKARP
jgi:hypothetical protein